MKTSSFFIAVLFLFPLLGPSAKADVKISISSTVKPSTGKQPSAPMVIYMSGAKMRSDSKLAITIMDFDANQMTLLYPAKKTYYSGPYVQTPGPALNNKTTVTTTDEKIRVLGHLCHHYVIKTPDYHGVSGFVQYDILATNDFGTEHLNWPAHTVGPRTTSMIKGLPLRVTSDDGKYQLTWQVNSIATTKLPRDTFSVPSNYKK